MIICGLQKLAMVDYPGKLAATVFTGGCNLRCPFCHNALLVTGVEQNEVLSAEDILSFLAGRRGLLDGVVLSGGEPLLQSGVPEFLRAVRALGFSVKLDTNGCYPDTLQTLLEEGLLDYVAMDIKNCPSEYSKTVGVLDFDLAPVERSISLLRSGRIPFEFRTTLVREFHSYSALEAIGRWLKGSPRYYLQAFVDSGGLIGEGLHAFSPEEMRDFAELVRPCFSTVEVRGI